LYRLSESIFVHCLDTPRLYKVTSVTPLAVQAVQAYLSSFQYYYIDIAAINHDTMIAIFRTPKCVHLVKHNGNVVRDVTKTWKDYVFRHPMKVSSCENGTVAILDSNHGWDTECNVSNDTRVVCLTVSGLKLSHNWTSDVLVNALTPAIQTLVITSNAVVVICSDPNSVIVLALDTGRRLRHVTLSPSPDLVLRGEVCAHNGRLFVSCYRYDVVAELHLQGKLWPKIKFTYRFLHSFSVSSNFDNFM
jgi:hypothetical protein